MSKKSKLPSLVERMPIHCLYAFSCFGHLVVQYDFESKKEAPSRDGTIAPFSDASSKSTVPNHRLLLMPLKTNHHNMASLLSILLFASVRDSKLSLSATFRIHLTLAGLPPPLSPLETVFISLSDTSVQLCVSPRAIIRWWVKCIYTGKSGRSVQKLIDGGKA